MASRSSCARRNRWRGTGPRAGWSHDTSGSDHPTTFTLGSGHKGGRREAHSISRSDLYADALQNQPALQTVRAWLFLGSAAVSLMLLYTIIFSRLANVPLRVRLIRYSHSVRCCRGHSSPTGCPARPWGSGELNLLARVYFPREILPLSLCWRRLWISDRFRNPRHSYVLLPNSPVGGVLWAVPAIFTLGVFLIGIALFASALQVRFAMSVCHAAGLTGMDVCNARCLLRRRAQNLRHLYDLNPLVGIMEHLWALLRGQPGLDATCQILCGLSRCSCRILHVVQTC